MAGHVNECTPPISGPCYEQTMSKRAVWWSNGHIARLYSDVSSLNPTEIYIFIVWNCWWRTKIDEEEDGNCPFKKSCKTPLTYLPCLITLATECRDWWNFVESADSKIRIWKRIWNEIDLKIFSLTYENVDLWIITFSSPHRTVKKTISGLNRKHIKQFILLWHIW